MNCCCYSARLQVLNAELHIICRMFVYHFVPKKEKSALQRTTDDTQISCCTRLAIPKELTGSHYELDLRRPRKFSVSSTRADNTTNEATRYKLERNTVQPDVWMGADACAAVNENHLGIR